MNHLFYATSATFPSQLANRKQIVNQMRAFASVEPTFRSTLGIAKGRDILSDESFECQETGTTYLPLLAWRQIQMVRRQQITHVYCREPRLLIFFLLARRCGLIRRSTVVAFEIHSLAIDARLLKSFLRYVDRIVAVNPVLVKDALPLLPKGKTVLVAHDAADPDIFMTDVSQASARLQLGIAESGIVAVYTGRFRTMGMDKGLQSVIRAVAQLVAEENPLQVYAVGGADEEIAAYTAYAREHTAESFITFVPYQSQENVALYHAAADILLMPFPRTEHFARAMSPLKLFEYLMAGRAIIATKLPSIADVLTEGSVLAIEPDSDRALHDALEKLAGNKDLRERLGSTARQVSRQYTWDTRARVIAAWLGLH